MKANLSILERNVCHGLQCVDGADDLFLRLLPSVGLQEAEKAANEWLIIGGLLDAIRPAMERNRLLLEVQTGHAGNLHATSEVREFIRQRQFGRFKRGNNRAEENGGDLYIKRASELLSAVLMAEVVQ